jgi:hypothetical protein
MASKTKHRSVSSSAAPQTEVVKTSGKSGVRTFSQEFKPDYSFVKSDLKRIAFLAGTFLVILIVLSFFLR